LHTYPLNLSFKIIAIAPQIRVTDAAGQLVLYVRQKALALREDVRVYADEQQRQQLYQLNADRIIDWSASYLVRTADGQELGHVRRKGMRSLWKATYEVVDPTGTRVALIHEENPWVKVIDGLVGEIPIVGMIVPMFINPSYLVDRDGQAMLRVRKHPAVFEGKFSIEKLDDFDSRMEALLLNSVLMMLLLERQRG
jgi:uncharacterized protein YxjI